MLLDINLCASGPCQNNASCENFRTFYTCNCAAGFEGVNCQMGKNVVSVRLQPAGKTVDISWSQHWFPRDMMSERNKRRNSRLRMWHHPIWVVLLIGWKFASSNQKQYPDGVVTHHQYGIPSLLVGKLEVASSNVGCFLRLVWCFEP